MSELKPVVLHFHIFKNAGTTIDTILEQNFKENAVRMDVDKPGDILPMEVVTDYLKKNPSVKSFSSHQIRFPLPENSNFYFIPMVFIRQPLDRIFSIYSFNKNRDDIRTISAAQAKTSSLSEYIQLNLQHKTNMIMKNFQVLFLSQHETKVTANKNELMLAIERIKKCPIIGIVDRLDESLIVAQEILQKFFPTINLSYVSKNVSKGRGATLDERLEAGHLEIGDELWQKLLEKNELDLKLYLETNKELDKRIEKIKNFEEKLKKFLESQKEKNLLSKNSAKFENKRIWFSSEKKSLYYGNPKEGVKKILHYFKK